MSLILVDLSSDATARQRGALRSGGEALGLGVRMLEPPVPDLAEVLADYSLPPADAALISERAAQIESARSCGAASVGVLWGDATRPALERTGADWICATPDEVHARLSAWFARPLPLRQELLALRRVPRQRPAQIDAPAAGQVSCWDFPRPPRLLAVPERLRVEHAGTRLADSRRGLQVQETAGPPTYYVPPTDVALSQLVPLRDRSLCEWKGEAHHWGLPGVERSVAWSYPDPLPGYEPLRDHLAFFASRVDACYLGEERVRPQPGGYYGGWITHAVTGPFKGRPGTEGW